MRFYEKHLAGQIGMMMTHGRQLIRAGSPELKDAVLHARISMLMPLSSKFSGSFPKFIAARTDQIRANYLIAVSNALIAHANNNGPHIGKVCA